MTTRTSWQLREGDLARAQCNSLSMSRSGSKGAQAIGHRKNLAGAHLNAGGGLIDIGHGVGILCCVCEEARGLLQPGASLVVHVDERVPAATSALACLLVNARVTCAATRTTDHSRLHCMKSNPPAPFRRYTATRLGNQLTGQRRSCSRQCTLQSAGQHRSCARQFILQFRPRQG